MSAKKPSSKEDLIKSVVIDDIFKEFDSRKQKNNNLTIYNLFKPIDGVESVNLEPFIVEENKRLAELMEDLPKIDELTSEDFELKINEFSRKIRESHLNANSILSKKVSCDKNGKIYNIDVSNLNLLDYQFIILYMFCITNQFINYRVDMDANETEEKFKDYLNFKLPITPTILEILRNKMEYSTTVEGKRDKSGEEYKIKLDYGIKKLTYKSDSLSIFSEKIGQEAFSNWKFGASFNVSDNLKLHFRFVTIFDFLKIYTNLIKIQKSVQLKVINKVSSEILDMNTSLFSDLMYSVTINGETFVLEEYPEIEEAVRQKFSKFYEYEILEITKSIYSNVLRLEIDISVLDAEGKVIKTDTWFDSGLSFFLTF